MGKIKITQVRSTIKRPRDQKETIICLGLGKINRTVEKEATPQILGMVRKVAHLIRVEEVK
jgi:large subunit ribosomal protein L30